MTGAEWIDTVVKELEAAGFTVKMLEGWPMVSHPESMEDTVRLLKHRPSVDCERILYVDGMLYLPPEVAAGLPSRQSGRP